MNHQNVGFEIVVRCVCVRPIVRFGVGAIGNIFQIDIERLIEIEIVHVLIVVFVSVFPSFVISELVFQGHIFPLCFRLVFRPRFKINVCEIRFRDVRPFLRIDHTACRFRRERATARRGVDRTRPAIYGRDDRSQFFIIVHFKAGVFDNAVIHFRARRRGRARRRRGRTVGIRARSKRRARRADHHRR